jgi:glycosyltransferase involved in cell wall biosynthesis
MADAFVTPSVSEVHPLSIIEGMAVGLPAIGIESPGVGDIIQHNVNGMLCRNDLADFTARMVRLMLDDTLRIRLASGATQTAKHYDIRRTSSQLHDHYQEIIDSTMQDSITRDKKLSIGKFFR